MKTTKNKNNNNYERADYGRIGKENLATLTVKLPRELRQFWQIEARRRNQSLSFIITQLLEKELGKPDPALITQSFGKELLDPEDEEVMVAPKNT